MSSEKLYQKAKLIQEKMYQQNPPITRKVKEKLYKEFLVLVRKSAYLGNANAQEALAQTYEDINYLYIENPYFNPKKCIYWYAKACDQNHAVACNNLAPFYERGLGCNQNINKALALYQKSGELGYKPGNKNYKLMLKQIKKGHKFKKS